MFNQLEAIA